MLAILEGFGKIIIYILNKNNIKEKAFYEL